VEAGTARLVGADTEGIVRNLSALLTDTKARSAMSRSLNPYGDGQAARRIAEALVG